MGVMFLGVAWHAFGVYHEIQDGKKKLRDLGATATVGVGILGVGIFLVTKKIGVSPRFLYDFLSISLTPISSRRFSHPIWSCQNHNGSHGATE